MVQIESKEILVAPMQVKRLVILIQTSATRRVKEERGQAHNQPMQSPN